MNAFILGIAGFLTSFLLFGGGVWCGVKLDRVRVRPDPATLSPPAETLTEEQRLMVEQERRVYEEAYQQLNRMLDYSPETAYGMTGGSSVERGLSS